jgi:hypothetical protein
MQELSDSLQLIAHHGNKDSSIAVGPFRNRLPQVSGHQRFRGVVPHFGVLYPNVAAQFQQVSKPLGGKEGRLGALSLDHGISGQGGGMYEPVGALWIAGRGVG